MPSLVEAWEALLNQDGVRPVLKPNLFMLAEGLLAKELKRSLFDEVDSDKGER